MTSAISDSKGEFELKICASTDSYEYLHDRKKPATVQNLAARILPPKPMEHPSSNSHEAFIIEDGESIVLQSK